MAASRSLIPACLAAALATSPAAAQRAAVEPIWRAAEDGASISPEGRIVAFIDWDTGDVAIHEVGRDSSWRLTDNDAWASGGGWAEGPLVFAPAGDRIAHAFSNPRGGHPYRFELRVVSLADSIQHVLDTLPPDAPSLAPLDWHSQAGILYSVTWADLSSELRLVDPAERVPRTIARRGPGTGAPSSGLITPDGEQVLYIAAGRLFGVALDGSGERELGLAAEVLLGWHQRGRGLLFHATREGVTGNWLMPFSDGSLGRVAELLQSTSAGVVPGGRANGVAHFVERAESPRLHIASDLAESRTAAGSVAVTSMPDGAAGNPTWSADGGRLAYTLRIPNRPVHRIMVAAADGSAPREILRTTDHELVTGLAWSRDGTSLVLAGRGQSRGSAWIGRIDPSTGSVRKLVLAPTLAVATGPGGGVAYVQAAAAGDTTVDVVFLDADDAQPRVLATFLVREYPRAISVSPDGEWVAVIRPIANRSASILQLLPVRGGESRIVARLERPAAFDLNLGAIPWTADGSHVIVLARAGGLVRFHRVHVVSGAITPLPFGPKHASRTHPALHPDGRRIVYVDGAARAELKAIRFQESPPGKP